MELTIRQKKILAEYLEREDKNNNTDVIPGYDDGEDINEAEEKISEELEEPLEVEAD